MRSALSLQDIDAYYGDSHVLQKLSFELGEGRLLGLLGRNGAGKSTCLNVAVGLLTAPRWRVLSAFPATAQPGRRWGYGSACQTESAGAGPR